jgi:chemotaxis protein MotB
MLRGTLSLWILVTATASLFAAGCCQEQENKIKDLTSQRDEALAQNKALRDQMSSLSGDSDATKKLLESKDAELANKDAEIAGLKHRLSDKTAPAIGAGGAPNWEHGLFGDKVVVGTDILFDSGKDTLKASGKTRLDAIIKDIKTHYPSMVIRVYGHTDTDKIQKSPWDDNWELSANRALTVARYLRSPGGINAKLIEPVAMGEFHPEGADKAKNRRVEIYAVKAK